MADIVLTDASHRDVGVVRGARLDVEFGRGDSKTANTIELKVDVDSGVRAELGAFVYVDGTEYGGVIDESESDPEAGTIAYTGRSWHGILAGKVICPPSGQSHRTASGEANAAILSVVGLLGLGDVMTASSEDSGISVGSYKFARYVDGYTGLLDMLASAGARLRVAYDSTIGRVALSAVPARDDGVGPDSNDARVSVRRVRRCVNHLISLGEGEGASRLVRHDYADASGNVSQVQTLFGVDEICETYDYSSADAERLAESAPERLRDMQDRGGFSAELDSDRDYAIGDTVPGVDVETGSEVTVPVSSKIVIVTDTDVSVECRAGDVGGAPSPVAYAL